LADSNEFIKALSGDMFYILDSESCLPEVNESRLLLGGKRGRHSMADPDLITATFNSVLSPLLS